MSYSLNKTQLLGYLGRNPEIVTMGNGNRVAKFSLATSDRWTDHQTGEQREYTEWHNVVIYNSGLISLLEKGNLKKGSRIYLEGRNQTRKYNDRNNIERSVTEIVIQQNHGDMIPYLDGGRDEKATLEQN